jgi:hypothetical protein
MELLWPLDRHAMTPGMLPLLLLLLLLLLLRACVRACMPASVHPNHPGTDATAGAKPQAGSWLHTCAQLASGIERAAVQRQYTQARIHILPHDASQGHTCEPEAPRATVLRHRPGEKRTADRVRNCSQLSQDQQTTSS